MVNKFQDRYRISSTRLVNWDYSWNALYFVTINTHGQEEFLGEIENGKMIYSYQGIIANILWLEIKNHFDFIELDTFVIMPNHVHGIIGINNPLNYGKMCSRQEHKTEQASSLWLKNETTISPVQKRQRNPGKYSLSTVIGSYKSAVSKHAHRLAFRFEWQSRFHDRIIRNEEALFKARKYIESNISNWEKDPFNKFGSYERK